MTLFELLRDVDTRLFELIHERLRNPVFDVVLRFFSHPFPHWKIFGWGIWGGLLVLGRKRWRLSLLFVAVALGLSDFLSSQVIKELVARPRPLGGTSFSFPSSHAANVFSASTFAFFCNKKLWPLLVVALMVAFSRIYVGAHYPADVLAGMALGGALGYGVYIARGTAENRMPERLAPIFPPGGRSESRGPAHGTRLDA